MPAAITTITMSERLLRLLSWVSPAFPTGGFACSHGLEWSVEAGDVGNEAELVGWIADLLGHGAGWSDGVLARHAWRGDVARCAELATALALPAERLEETLSMGDAFLRAAAAWRLPALPAGRVAYPVAFAALAAHHGLGEEETVLALLHAYVAMLVSAAVRLVPLGQSAGLRATAALEPAILRVLHESREATLDDLGGAAIRAEIAAMRHETQATRLFRT